MINSISHIPYNFSFCRGTFGRVLYTSTRFSLHSGRLQSKKVVNQHFIGISSKKHINVSFQMILKQTNGLFIKTE